jgi:hypothetical protein
MPNIFNNGNVTLYASSPDGLTTAPVSFIDLNGSSTNNLGFVRLAMDATGTGWILAGDGLTLYLANFIAHELNNTTINLVDDNVTIVGSSASVFQNGDLCFSGTGAIYALANDGGGITQIFSGAPNGNATVLTKKWDLTDPGGGGFTGSVNGVAFDLSGSLYISTGGTSGGLYFIDQNTVNTATGTVQCSLVWSGLGLTDLASNFFPAQTTLPLRLVSFSGSYRNQKAILNWETEREQDFSHFEIERISERLGYAPVGIEASRGSNRQTYQFIDDLSAETGTVFRYRLKMVDKDGRFSYSKDILIRREALLSHATINPSPVINGQATLRFYSAKAGSAFISIIEPAGRIAWQRKYALAAGNNSIVLNELDRFAPGIYLIRVESDQSAEALKIQIAR